jgi:hypothetical protein
MITREQLGEKFKPYWSGDYQWIDCDEGWFDLLDELHTAIVAIDPDYRIIQVKEKFGGLRYYVDANSPEVGKLIWEAEDKSVTICEVCGKPGSQRRVDFWITTRCDEHEEP